jgi:5-methylcytosine-specific restriction endonuclease McrA
MPNDYLVYLKSLYWQYQRSRALCRAGLKCEKCGGVPASVELEVHHKTYERLGEEELEDLVVLCHGCHREEHGLPRSKRRPIEL